MSDSRFVVVQSEHLDPRPAAWLAERCDLLVHPHDRPGFDDALARADALVVRTYTRVDRDLLDKAPTLKVVARAGVALENIDVPACRRRGVEVVHAPGSNAQAVVEYVLALLGEALRPRTRLTRALSQAEWDQVRADEFAEKQIDERTVGVLGFGRIGSRVAEVARAVGCRVLYHDLIEIPESRRHGAVPVDVDDLFADADILTVHVDSRPENRRFVDRERIRRMKGDVLFLNTSRGFVVDIPALAEFLREHPQAKAIIDVHDPEPFGPEYPLLGLPNATLYPHLAGRTKTALESMSWVVRDVWRVLNGEAPEHPAP